MRCLNRQPPVPSKCLVMSMNRANRAFQLATPINHTHCQCHALCYVHAQTAGLLPAVAQIRCSCARGVCAPKSSSHGSCSLYQLQSWSQLLVHFNNNLHPLFVVLFETSRPYWTDHEWTLTLISVIGTSIASQPLHKRGRVW